MAREFVFHTYGLNKYYGQKHVLKDISLSFYPGAKIGIVGENGSGKTTLLRIMAGEDDDFQGTAQPEAGVRIRHVHQEPKLDPEKTVRETLEEAFADTVKLLKEYDELTASMGDMDPDEMEKAMNRMGVLQDRIEAAGGWDLDTKLSIAANALVLPPDEMKIGTLSGGEHRRVALCKALLEQPDILLLDEPTNHLDAETVDWLEQQLIDYPGTVIISTHDRYFLDNITKWILELDNGRGIPFEGNYTSWLEQKLAALARQEKKESPRRKALDHELRWIRMSTADRHELGQKRIKEYEALVVREQAEASEEGSLIQIAPAPHLGDKVLDVDDASKSYGERLLFEEMEFHLPRAGVVGVIGPNGAGKTTLFRMIIGKEEPDTGSVELGPTVVLAHVDQLRDTLNDDNTVFDEISEGKTEIDFGKVTIPARNYVGRFNFKGSDQQKPVRSLSGGERNRVYLAKLLKRGGNLILLDEPTNDLDVGTLRLLEEAIHGFSGCMMIISHDRFFLNRVCTHLLVFEGDGKVRWFEGNYEEYEAIRRKEVGDAVFENRRLRYRRVAKA